MTALKANNATECHLVIQTYGGPVADGVFIYSVLRALDIPLTIYNIGSVQSIGVIAYLGAKVRKVSAHASFMLHATTFSPPTATADQLKGFANGASVDDKRTRHILDQHTKLTTTHWKRIKNGFLALSAEDAVAIGIATEIGDFSPPSGAQWFHI